MKVKLDKPFPQRVALTDDSDAITMVELLYSWLPSTCTGCGHLGHKSSRCLLLSAATSIQPTAPSSQKVNEIYKEIDPNIISSCDMSSITQPTANTSVEKNIGID